MTHIRNKSSITPLVIIYLWIIIGSGDAIGIQTKVTNTNLLEVPIDTPEVMPCPNPDEIKPCECTFTKDYAMTMFCSNITNDELRVIFGKEFPFTTFDELNIYDDAKLESLRAGDLGNSTFRKVFITASELGNLEDQALEGSQDTILFLDLMDNNLTSLLDISQFKHLQALDISLNAFAEFPRLASSSLELLYFVSNTQLETVPSDALSELPSLEVVSLIGCSLTDIRPGAFTSNQNLSALFLDANDLSSIPQDAIQLHGPDNELSLSYNQISQLPPGAFSGVTGSLRMDHNSLEILDEEVWRPVLEDGVELTLADNPFGCDCDVAWLIVNQTLLDYLKDTPTCADGTSFMDLDPDYYAAVC